MPPSSTDKPIRCSLCPCGCVCLRWRRALLMHLDPSEITCALDCLGEMLQQPSCGFSLGGGSFSACRAADGFCYLLCKENVILRLSPEEAGSLRSELAAAHAALELQGQKATSLHVM